MILCLNVELVKIVIGSKMMKPGLMKTSYVFMSGVMENLIVFMSKKTDNLLAIQYNVTA